MRRGADSVIPSRVKFAIILPLAILALALPAQAGNMFGPAPFRNGSPLVTGIDGTYQATARAENVTGIFRFAYSGGSQTANARANSWVFFVNGQVYRGPVEANLNESSLDGILDSNLASSASSTNDSLPLPYVFINPGDKASGSFSGKIQLKSASGAFSGNGILRGAPGSTDQIVGISETLVDESSTAPTDVPAGAIYVTTKDLDNAAGQLLPIQFSFRGVRTSTSATQSTNIAQ